MELSRTFYCHIEFLSLATKQNDEQQHRLTELETKIGEMRSALLSFEAMLSEMTKGLDVQHDQFQSTVLTNFRPHGQSQCPSKSCPKKRALDTLVVENPDPENTTNPPINNRVPSPTKGRKKSKKNKSP